MGSLLYLLSFAVECDSTRIVAVKAKIRFGGTFFLSFVLSHSNGSLIYFALLRFDVSISSSWCNLQMSVCGDGGWWWKE